MNKQEAKRLPSWLSRKMGQPSSLHNMKNILRSRNLHTVCESARCPNIGECFSKPTATFMILGNICTRGCAFCAVDNSCRPPTVDPDEPENIAVTAKELSLRHVVITSVTRDDLDDGGAAQFAATIMAIRRLVPSASIEVLTPDFKGDLKALKIVMGARPDIFNHNIETVPSLYKTVRPQADYNQSLMVIRNARELAGGILTKSGIMVGLGETMDEIKSVIKDLAATGCDAITIGQYLRPAKENPEVREYISPEVFKEYEAFGREAGLKFVYSGPFVRSSYNAEEFAGRNEYRLKDEKAKPLSLLT